MRILLYTAVGAVGGAEIALANLLGALPTGYDLHLAGTSGPVLRWLAAHRPGLACHLVRPGLPAHLGLLRRLRPELVQVNLEAPWAAPAMLGAAHAWPGTRVVAVQHMGIRTVALAQWLRTRALARRLDAHVAVSADAAKRVEDFYALGRGSIQVIYNGIPVGGAPGEPPALATDGPREGLAGGWSGAALAGAGADGRLVVGSVGRLDRVKGHDVLIRALARVPAVTAVILGAGGQASALHELAERLGVADRVSLPGWSDRVGEWLDRCDVYCQPSRYEGLGLALMEAMRAGLPCVASGVGGVPELLDDGRCGVLVPPDDPATLATALAELVTDPARQATLGTRGRRRIETRFTIERMVSSYQQLWGEVRAAPRTSRLRPPAPRP